MFSETLRQLFVILNATAATAYSQWRVQEVTPLLIPHAHLAAEVMKHMKISASLDKGTPNMERWHGNSVPCDVLTSALK